MSYPKRMTKVVLAGHKRHLEATVDALYEADLLHVEDFVEGDESDFEIGMPIEYGEEVSRKLVKVRSIANVLNIKPTSETVPLTESDVSKELDAKLAQMDNEIDQNAEKLSALDARVKDIESSEKEILPFLAYDIDLKYFNGYDNLAVFSGTVSSFNESRLLEITDAYQLFADSSSKFFVLFVSKKVEKEVQSILADMGYRETKAPNKSGNPSDIFAALEAEKSEIQAQIETLIAERAALNEKYGNFILASDEFLSILSEKAELPLRIATSEHTFIIEGWVPTADFDAFTAAVSNKTNNGVYITTLEVDMHDEKEIAKIPVAYENSKITSPMEAVVDLYSRPKYNEIDPSSILAISFPLVYGMILGDIGYALVLMTLAFLVMKFMKSDAVKQLMYVLIYCQISALFFGIIYGEFMGFPLAGLMSHGVYTPGLIPGLETIVFDFGIIAGEPFMFPIHRTHMIMTFLIATAGFGFLHLNVGYIVGFFDVKGQHGVKHAVLEKLSWIVLEIGVIAAIVAWYLGLGTVGIAVGAIIAVIGVVMLAKGEGIKGPIEIPGLLGNILSYTRIIAVGLSSIYIASTVNDIAFGGLIWTPADGFSVMMFISILIFILGHSLNTVLSIIAPGLHALRLQYVEFFGKFYASGGKAYKPFGHLKKYILEE
ncbi:V-type ATP synthase subunit I [Porphyromonadaceae bacterium OttesenSCG-928-L07]|nr:V-type ATP synthase subunit I [Porphyromonadaceae bacterium OttesenSCG-928-L07]